MVATAWFMDSSNADQREPHQCVPNKPVSLQQLAEFGVLSSFISVDHGEEHYTKEIDAFSAKRDYKNRDVINIHKDTFPNYDQKIKTFFEEHIHEDEEIRFILDGSGYFDVRSPEDKWIRIAVGKGDLIILPAGIYHRFTLDSHNYIKAMRLFKEEPKWTPVNRELPTTDKNAYRVAYLKELNSVGKIYTYPNNPRTARALIAARYNGQHIEIVPVEPSVTNATREYLHKFPLGDIPAFEAIDGFTVTGANAIAQYVASAKVGSPLMGGNVKEAARVQQFVALVDGELAPAQAAWLFPLLGWIQKDETATKKAILDTKRVMTALNEHLRHNTYLVGQAVTLADITAVVVLLNFYRMVFDEQFRNEFKSVTRWFLTCVNQEEFKDVLGDVILA